VIKANPLKTSIEGEKGEREQRPGEYGNQL